MRKWLILFLLIGVAILGVLWWLGQSYAKQQPEAGEVRMEIEHAF